MKKEIKRQLDIIKRGTAEIIQEKELAEKIEKSLDNKKPLIIKAGFDPTAPDLHLGHTVLLRKLRHFQDLGHKVIFLIGDFTAQIGDPTGQKKIRPKLSKEEIERNAQTYVQQVSKILNTSKGEVFELRHNSEWLNEMKLQEIFVYASATTANQILARADFKERYEHETKIDFQEFFYPLLQAYDSVKLNADVEIGGIDQKFNLLMGRQMQNYRGQPPQVIIMTPLLEGLDGVQKMSKSLGNYIGINESPKEIFGKVMSVSDNLMWRYYELLTDKDYQKLKDEVKENRLHPKQAKVDLAKEIVSFYHGASEAEKAEKEFEQIFKNKQAPENIPVFETNEDKMTIWDLVNETNKDASASANRRLIEQGGVVFDDLKITDFKQIVPIKNDAILKIGKRKFIKIFRPIL